MEDIYTNIIKEIAQIKDINGKAIQHIYKSIKENVDKLPEQEAKDALTVWMFKRFLDEFAVPLKKIENEIRKLKRE